MALFCVLVVNVLKGTNKQNNDLGKMAFDCNTSVMQAKCQYPYALVTNLVIDLLSKVHGLSPRFTLIRFSIGQKYF